MAFPSMPLPPGSSGRMRKKPFWMQAQIAPALSNFAEQNG